MDKLEHTLKARTDNISDRVLQPPNLERTYNDFTESRMNPSPLTSRRLQYQAELDVIKRKIGTISDIRKELRISSRQLAMLLLVDPSSLSRWQRNDQDAPPYIYRALQWYLALIEKHPEWHPYNRFQNLRSDMTGEIKSSLRQELNRELDQKMKNLKNDQSRSMHFIIPILFFLLGVTASGIFFYVKLS